jgi:hypothetical protein
LVKASGLRSVKAGLGAGNTVRLVTLVANVPSRFVTVTVPSTDWSDILAVILVGLMITTFVALSLPTFTVVPATKFVPVIVIDPPWQTVAGEKEVIVGACARAGIKRTISKRVIKPDFRNHE